MSARAAHGVAKGGLLSSRRALSALIGLFVVASLSPAGAQLDTSKTAADEVTKRLLRNEAVGKIKGETLVVGPFEAVAPATEADAALFQDKLSADLLESGNFKIVERARLDQAVKELKLQASGLTDGDAQKQLGKFLNAGYLILGSVSKVNARVSATVRVVEVETATAIAAVNLQTGQPEDKTTSKRRRIAVVDFTYPADWHWGAERLSRVLSDMLTTSLVKSGTFDVIERNELDKALKENNLTATGVLDPATSVNAGKVLGVNYVLGGKITEFGLKTSKLGGGLFGNFGGGVKQSKARAVIDARVIDCTSGKILCAVTGEGENDNIGVSAWKGDLGAINFGSDEWTTSTIGKATRVAVDKVIAGIVANFPKEASVKLALPDGTLILDIGKSAGVKPGDEFDIIHEEQILDPDTKEVVFSERKTIGVAKVTEVQDERCKAEFTPAKDAKAGIAPKKGDLCTVKKK